MSNWLDDLTRALKAAGVETVLGVPGGGTLFDFAEGLGGSGIQFVSMANEAAATVAAGAMGWARRGIGCSLSIKGPGVANALPGIVSNYYEQWPVLSVADGGAGVPGMRVHKALDHQALLRTCTKAYACGGKDAGIIPALVDIAASGIPGPVHIDLNNSQSSITRNEVHAVVGSARRDPIDAALDLLDRSRRPAVVVGSSVRGARWEPLLRSLRVPVFTTAAAKGAFDETSPWAAGVFTGDGKGIAPEVALLGESDLVVGIGLRNLEVLSPKPFSQPLVLLDTIGHATDAFQARVAATDARDDEMERVLGTIAERQWGADIVGDSRRRVEEYLVGSGWLPGLALDCLMKELSDAKPTLVADTGNFCIVAEHLWPAREWTDYCGSSNGRFMGMGIPMALGLCMAAPRRPVVCVVGDGGIRSHVAELREAVARRLPLLVLLMADGRYGSIAAGKSDRTDAFIRIAECSWYRAIETLGFDAWQACDASSLAAAVRGWRPHRGPAFIEAAFEEAPYTSCVSLLR